MPHAVAFIALWIGPPPRWMEYFLRSCAHNPGVTWLLFCDHALAHLPENVKQYPATLASLSERFSRVTGTYIPLETGYKLCDFRPLYGEAFAEELKSFSFWGHCDLDLVWGDLSALLSEEHLKGCDILSTDAGWISGPCSVYRNTPAVNALWRDVPDILALLRDATYRNIEERRMPWVVQAHPEIRIRYEHHMPYSDEGEALWDNGRILRPNGTELSFFHFFDWKGEMQLFNATTNRWHLSKEGIQDATKTLHVPQPRSRSVFTVASHHDFPPLQALLTSLREHDATPITVYDAGLTPEERGWCETLSHVRVSPALHRIPYQHLLSSTVQDVVWLAPSCVVQHSLDDVWELLRGRPVFLPSAPDDGTWKTPPVLDVVAIRRDRPTDASVIARWIQLLEHGEEPSLALSQALYEAAMPWSIICHNGWNQKNYEV